MPELPEVQTVVNSLKSKIIELKFYKVELIWKRVIYNLDNKVFVNHILNKTILDVYRIGKFIVFKLDKGMMLCHLRMTGRLFINNGLPNNLKHISAYFHLNNNKFLIFEDIRKFGGFMYLNNIDIIKKKYGVDPTSKQFTLSWLRKNIKSRSRQMKHLLLDQSFISGLGNIYTDEIMWSIRVHPQTISNTLNNETISKLLKETKSILLESIKHHGTTIRDFKFDQMKTGRYKNKLKVYGREKLPCKRCKNTIIKTKVAGRGTYLCPACQSF